MEEQQILLLKNLRVAVQRFGRADADLSDVETWLACETEDICSALSAAIDSAESEEARGEETRLAWQIRELRDQLDATTDLARKVRAVWELWLTDAEQGSIDPSTFDSMKAILGMERS